MTEQVVRDRPSDWQDIGSVAKKWSLTVQDLLNYAANGELELCVIATDWFVSWGHEEVLPIIRPVDSKTPRTTLRIPSAADHYGPDDLLADEIERDLIGFTPEIDRSLPICGPVALWQHDLLAAREEDVLELLRFKMPIGYELGDADHGRLTNQRGKRITHPVPVSRLVVTTSEQQRFESARTLTSATVSPVIAEQVSAVRSTEATKEKIIGALVALCVELGGKNLKKGDDRNPNLSAVAMKITGLLKKTYAVEESSDGREGVLGLAPRTMTRYFKEGLAALEREASKER